MKEPQSRILRSKLSTFLASDGARWEHELQMEDDRLLDDRHSTVGTKDSGDF